LRKYKGGVIVDIYQRKLVDSSKIELDNKDAKVVFLDDAFLIEQSENAYIEKYNVTLHNPAISNIEIDKIKIDSLNQVFHFTLDFTKKSKIIHFDFVDNIADSFDLEIRYNEKSKEDWDEKSKIDKWKELEPKAQIKVSTGIDLVNIYFQPCSDDYGKTVIELYTAIGKWSEHPRVIGRGMTFVPSLLSATIDSLMGKFTVEDGMFFKSITGLALGAYGFSLSQYSSKGSLLFTSDYQFFAIQKK